MNEKRIAEEEKLAAEEAARIAAGRLNGSSKWTNSSALNGPIAALML